MSMPRSHEVDGVFGTHRVEVGIAGEESEQERERFTQRTDQAVQELETLLQARTDAIRPSAPGDRQGPTTG